jgi:hypothetical protein
MRRGVDGEESPTALAADVPLVGDVKGASGSGCGCGGRQGRDGKKEGGCEDGRDGAEVLHDGYSLCVLWLSGFVFMTIRVCDRAMQDALLKKCTSTTSGCWSSK